MYCIVTKKWIINGKNGMFAGRKNRHIQLVGSLEYAKKYKSLKNALNMCDKLGKYYHVVELL